ncbi:Aste57867_6838 [Aphanomyces stellatus]|uniref:Aste57867_6838 protein n=1 Tax=Aphanomyces stellatus TaxID=120398 RepID=A0A485KEK8_9STRA|nr:hypothetical protein As57867_006817 [Aphanomyces stellatus]VFT83800.1 Aste57867_6838 [Aphanomyces stellatus]
MWWPDFNASGTQTFLGDVVNLRLAWASSSMTFDLFSSGNGWVKDYSSASAAMALSYVYPRVLLMQSTSNLEDVIRGIHATTLALNMRMLTQYCWADFDKRFELAHTEYRQQRCLDQDADNAAVHLESLLRNVVWSDMVSTYGSTDGIFDVAIGAGVSEFPHGPAWLQSVHDAFVDVATEATYWRAKGAVRWQLPWQNAWQPGVDETITIQNALGMQQKLALKKIPYQHRGPAWTSMLLYYGFWNDISYAYSGGRSLVRNTTTHSPDEMQYRAYAGGGNGPVAHLTRNVLGPYGSIDAKVVPAPASLVTAFAEFSTAFAVALHADSTLVSFVTESTDVVINPVPMSWASPSLAFYGGSLLCVQGNPVDYVQESFGFDDACLAQNELAVTLSATNLAFALIGAQGMASLCSGGVACQEVLSTAQILYNHLGAQPTLASLFQAAAADVIDVCLVQYAANITSGNLLFLTQSLVTNLDDPWNAVGWVYLFDWLVQNREVVLFQGDVDSVTIISKAYATRSFAPSALEIPQSAGRYVHYLNLYISGMLAVATSFILFHAIQPKGGMMGRNFFHFNRVAGSTWVGRIFLFIRGMTAVIFLSTSCVSFTNQSALTQLAWNHMPVCNTAEEIVE